MRSITKLDLQYAHRFYGFKGEAQYLHGHTGVLTLEVEDSIEPGVNMVFPCNEIQKTAWEVLKNFDHALILREDDPLLPAILGVYEEQGIRNGAPSNKMKGPAFKTELATAYPECRLVVTKETMTVEGMIEILQNLPCRLLNFVAGENHIHARFNRVLNLDGQNAGMSMQILSLTLKAVKSVCVLKVQCSNASHSKNSFSLYLQAALGACMRLYRFAALHSGHR